MAAPSLDTEFMAYWSRLTTVQKESLLKVVQSFVPDGQQTLEEYNRDIEAAEQRINAGAFQTQEEVERMSKDW
ncbi:hypothetical protein [Paracnuella aquatica]|uniref:hypothetical protein n=1 Tax=Paracnuella aquatica TaxID=2268757 RepID=UPI000F4F3DB0|nr:hypothetical protein [Paracnuella aquatica]RPD50760.1 hypothetical protein DRJ53_07555 [Paracnuella aquatica]